MSMNLALSSEYNRDFFVPIKDAPWWKILMVRLLVPFYLPGLALGLLQSAPENFMTRKNEK